MLKVTSKEITSKRVGSYSRSLKRLTAAGLSRILDHMWKGPFGIISAARVKDKDKNLISDEENYERNGNLKEVLKQKGHGWIDFAGGYMYEEEDAPDFPVKEASVFLPGISEQDLRDLAVQFEQESYIFGDKGYWKLQPVAEPNKNWGEGLVADMLEPLKDKDVSKEYPFMSQIGTDRGHQFRLDTDLVDRRQEAQDQLSRHQYEQQHRVAFRLVGGKAPCFYSIAGEFRPCPPVCLASSGIKLSGNCPSGSLLECWLPLQKIS